MKFGALKKSERFVNSLPHYREVKMDDAKVSEEPLASFAYFFCTAIILKDKTSKKRGLSHIVWGMSAKPQLDKMINEFDTPAHELSAIIIDCHPDQDIKRECRKYKLELVLHYHGPQKQKEALQRDILVLPEEEKIKLFVENYGETSINF